MSELRKNILTGNWVVLAPERGRKPTRLHDQAVSPDLRGLPDDTLRDLSRLVGRSLRRYVDVLGNPDFNYFIHSCPYPLSGIPYYHLYIQLVPRISHIGGIEMGTRIPVNAVSPEDSAIQLNQTEMK